MKGASASPDSAAVCAGYRAIEAPRLGAAALLKEDLIMRVMVVRNEIPQTFVE